jgi:hypothetical protein
VIDVGFTGTQAGMTDRQLAAVRATLLLARLGESVVTARHGDCVGADAEFHEIARSLNYDLIGHPPDDDSRRAFCEFDYAYEPRPYLERDDDIARSSSVLVAAPRREETRRSGTWTTVRYARKLGRPIILVWPDGRVEIDGGAR